MPPVWPTRIPDVALDAATSLLSPGPLSQSGHEMDRVGNPETPDDRTGEAIQAWVVPRPGETVTEEEILDFLHGYLARFKWPKDIRIVDEVPRQVTGKLVRRALRGQEVLGSPELEEESAS